MTEFEVANVVGTITYQQELDLAALSGAFEKIEEINDTTYEPSKNHWLQTHIAPDNTYVAFYRSGSCSIVGCTSIEHFQSTVQNTNKIMSRLLDFDYKPESEINNIVATAKVDHQICLETLMIKLGVEKTEYEPEQFPALMYFSTDCTVLIFSSGKIVCTGLTNLDAVSQVIKKTTTEIKELK